MTKGDDTQRSCNSTQSRQLMTVFLSSGQRFKKLLSVVKPHGQSLKEEVMGKQKPMKNRKKSQNKWLDKMALKVAKDYIELEKARERVIMAAKRWRGRWMYTAKVVPTNALIKAIDSLIKLEGNK